LKEISLKGRNNRWKIIMMRRTGINLPKLDPFIISGMDFYIP
jgi:hypothetical protein